MASFAASIDSQQSAPVYLQAFQASSASRVVGLKGVSPVSPYAAAPMGSIVPRVQSALDNTQQALRVLTGARDDAIKANGLVQRDEASKVSNLFNPVMKAMTLGTVAVAAAIPANGFVAAGLSVAIAGSALADMRGIQNYINEDRGRNAKLKRGADVGYVSSLLNPDPAFKAIRDSFLANTGFTRALPEAANDEDYGLSAEEANNVLRPLGENDVYKKLSAQEANLKKVDTSIGLIRRKGFVPTASVIDDLCTNGQVVTPKDVRCITLDMAA